MPLATRGFDYIDGQPFADGGLCDPIPIRRALQGGATDITVVLMHKLDLRLKPLPRWLGKFSLSEIPRGRASLDDPAMCELQRRPRPHQAAAGGSAHPGISTAPAVGGRSLHHRAKKNRCRLGPGARRRVGANRSGC